MDEFEPWGALSGNQDVALLRRLAAQYTRSRSFPPPEGHDRWSDDAVDDLVATMYDAHGRDLVLEAQFTASSQKHLELRLLTVIGNYLKDKAKGTPTGLLRRRLETVLGGDERFVYLPPPPPAWALADGPQTRWQGDLGELERAALRVAGVRIIGLKPSGPTPRESALALRKVSEAVLVHAGGAVRAQDLAAVLIVRFPLIAPLTESSLEAGGADAVVAAPDEDPETQATVEVRAEELWAALSPTERALVPHLGKTDEEIAAVLQTTPREAKAQKRKLSAQLREASLDDPAADAAILALAELCRERP